MTKLPYLKKPEKFLFDGCKLLWHQDRLKDYLNGVHIAPIHIDMGIHKYCNIKCIYCYGIKQKPSLEFIPTDRLLMLAADAKQAGVKSIAVIGDGEPTLNKGLYSFVQFGRDIGIDMAVATNGLLLDHDQTRVLTDNLVWLRFSVSAVDKYDMIHGTRPGSFDKLETVVRDAVHHKGKCTIGLQMVLIPECFSEIVPLAKKAIEWKVDYLVIKQFSNPEGGIPVNFDMDLYSQAIEDLEKVEKMSNDKTKIIVKWSAIDDTRHITKYHYWKFDRCIDLPFIFQISGNGKCYPCGYMFNNEDYCYGDVTQERFKDIIVSSHYWNIVNRVSHIPLQELCKGQCRHTELNKFLCDLLKLYDGNLESALIKMCGDEKNYKLLMNNPPDHINYV